MSKNVPIRPHGAVRGLGNVDRSSSEGARFGRIFRWLPGESYDRVALGQLAVKLIQRESAEAQFPGSDVAEGPSAKLNSGKPLDEPFRTAEAGDENPAIPAGYTYFGQFIDHDLTFDPNSSLQKLNDPDATENFRTPRLDLDSLYGSGPDAQPYLYDDDESAIKFIVNRDRRGDLTRNINGRAIIGDPRNDENNIVSQLQVIFLNFHNKVIDQLGIDRPDLKNKPHEKFLLAQRIVRWHYQYAVVHDYLPKIIGEKLWEKIKGSSKPHLSFYQPKGGKAYIPVEFSVAAFRFGHSQVRPSYALNDVVGGNPSEDAPPSFGSGKFHRVPIFDGTTDVRQSLDGFQPLPEAWEIDWNFFFNAEGKLPVSVFNNPDDPHDGDNGKWQVDYVKHPNLKTQPGYRIDTSLVDPLALLPRNVAKSGDQPDNIPVLAYRNLLRGSQFQLPSGQNVARALGIKALTDEELFPDENISESDKQKGILPNQELREKFRFNAPLWYYILKESELKAKLPGIHGLPADAAGGHFLGPVGGHIVAEVLFGVLWYDHTSYLYQDHGWTPASEKHKSGFNPGPNKELNTLFAIIDWVTDGKRQFV